jgi:hypothetical protein
VAVTGAGASLAALAAFAALPLLSAGGASLSLGDLAVTGNGYEKFLAIGPVAGLAAAGAGLAIRGAWPNRPAAPWGASLAATGAALASAAISGLGAFLAARAWEPGDSGLAPGPGLVAAAVGTAVALAASLVVVDWPLPGLQKAAAGATLAAFAFGPWVPLGFDASLILDGATVAVASASAPPVAAMAAAAHVALGLAVAITWMPPIGGAMPVGQRRAFVGLLSITACLAVALGWAIHRLGAVPTGVVGVVLPAYAVAALVLDARRTPTPSSPVQPVHSTRDLNPALKRSNDESE